MASSYGQDASKSSIRSLYLTTRAAVPEQDRSRVNAAIRERLEDLPIWHEAPLVLSYVSHGSEIDTHAIIQDALDQGKRVAVPLFDPAARSLTFRFIDSLDELSEGFRSILEPSSSAPVVSLSEMLGSICLVPGLVFDGDGQRVGEGAAAFDRFLAFYPGDKIGLAATMQLSSNPLPCGPSDIAVDLIVSDGAI